MKNFFNIAIEELPEVVVPPVVEETPAVIPEDKPVETPVEVPVVIEDEEPEDIERTEDVVEGMKNLCEIITRIDTPTPINIALIKVAANMAVAGTDTPAQALFAANEDFKDLKVTVEGIKKKIDFATKAINNFKSK